MELMKLSIVIPAFNEAKTIDEVLEKIEILTLDGLSKEIIVVDDGSKDETSSIVQGHKGKNILLLKHKRNQGKGAAVITGIKKATGEIILIQDADLEYNPRDIPRLLKPILDKKAQVVYGARLSVRNPKLVGENRTPLILHAFGNKLLSLLTSLLYGYSVSDMETGYKVFHRNALRDIKLKSRSFDFEPEITAKILKRKIKIIEIPIETNERGYGEGKKLYALRDGPIALWTLIKYRFTD